MKRVSAYLVEGAVREDDLEQIFIMAGADELHRRAVADGLRQLGIRLMAAAETAPPPAGASCRRPAALPPQPSSQPAAVGTGAEPTAPTDEERQLRAARHLLEEDRWNRAPWKRVLTAEEEVGLARLLRGQNPLHEELQQGFRRSLPDGAEQARAFDALMLHNRGLVWSILRGFIGQGVELEDLEQSGYRGLGRSIEKFDAGKGFKFSTYATHWIRQAMSRAVADEGRLVRLPVYMHERVRKVVATRERLLVERGRAPLFDLAAATELRPAQVRECLNLAVGALSLDAPVGEDGGTTLGLLLDAEEFRDEDPLRQLIARAERQEIHDLVARLPEQQARVIRLRFGLDGEEPRTLDAIGQEYGVTREWIRQVEAKAKVALTSGLSSRAVG